jgi:hypothetical protein
MKPPIGIDGTEPTVGAIKTFHDYAVQQLDAAMESEIYICGMQPLEHDNPMYGIIVARGELECHDPVEIEYYGHPHPNTTWFNANLYGYCAG